MEGVAWGFLHYYLGARGWRRRALRSNLACARISAAIPRALIIAALLARRIGGFRLAPTGDRLYTKANIALGAIKNQG